MLDVVLESRLLFPLNPLLRKPIVAFQYAATFLVNTFNFQRAIVRRAKTSTSSLAVSPEVY